MQIILAESIKSKRIYNGDIYGHDNNLFYVCDGSTALFDDHKFYQSGDLYEYMQFIKNNLKEESNLNDSIAKAIKESNKNIPNYELYPEMELPTFTISAILEKKDTIEYLNLGDTLIAILEKNGNIKCFADHRLDLLTKMLLEEIKKINDNSNLSPRGKKEAIKIIEQTYRKKENSQDFNFYVASTNVNSIDQAIVGSINKREVDRILICSDGFYNGRDEIPTSSQDFLEESLEKRLKEKLNDENHDDITFMLLKNID